jgi:hypothetical protein
MKISLNKHILSAIETGLAEMDNSGIWSEDLTKKEIKSIEKGVEELEIILKKYKDDRITKKNLT